MGKVFVNTVTIISTFYQLQYFVGRLLKLRVTCLLGNLDGEGQRNIFGLLHLVFGLMEAIDLVNKESRKLGYSVVARCMFIALL